MSSPRFIQLYLSAAFLLSQLLSTCRLPSLFSFICVSAPRFIQLHLSVVFLLYSTSSVCHLPALFKYICAPPSFLFNFTYDRRLLSLFNLVCVLSSFFIQLHLHVFILFHLTCRSSAIVLFNIFACHLPDLSHSFPSRVYNIQYF